jgi:hypothetical protein
MELVVYSTRGFDGRIFVVRTVNSGVRYIDGGVADEGGGGGMLARGGKGVTMMLA